MLYASVQHDSTAHKFTDRTVAHIQIVHAAALVVLLLVLLLLLIRLLVLVLVLVLVRWAFCSGHHWCGTIFLHTPTHNIRHRCAPPQEGGHSSFDIKRIVHLVKCSQRLLCDFVAFAICPIGRLIGQILASILALLLASQTFCRFRWICYAQRRIQ
jgi:hypothetical protein